MAKKASLFFLTLALPLSLLSFSCGNGGGGTEARPEATRLVARWGIAVQLVYTPLEMYANPAGIGFSQATAAL